MFSILLCLGIFYLLDVVWNGFITDWFAKNYMTKITFQNVVNWQGHEIMTLNREPVKQLLMKVTLGIVLIWQVSIWITNDIAAKKKKKETVEDINLLLQDYMQSHGEAVLSKEYTEIATQLAAIKGIMQQNELILKEEAGKKNDLITYLAHDLKTPLTSVIGYLNLLDEVQDMPKEQRAKYIGITLDKAYRLEKLMNEFFEITRYNLQQIVLEKETINLSFMLIQMTDEFYPILNAHGNTVKLQVADNLIIYADSVKLARVFNNVLKNAIAYSYKDTEIEVWVEQASTNVKVFFRNQGKTIPKNKLEQIFEKFYRMDEARTTHTGGAGLGLAIAKEIIELHGGTITAESENERITFCIEIPIT